MPELKDCSILVTGATGFLGQVLVTHLRTLGARVTGTGRSAPNDTAGDLLQVDLEVPGALRALGVAGPYDVVIHCAAVLPGRAADSDVLFANQRMTDNLLAWAVSARIAHFLFASTCNIYGYLDRQATESATPHPPNRYALSKFACEHLANLAARPGGMRVCALRVSAPYGPHLLAETVVKRFIQHAARHGRITLMGSGGRSQDFVYEADTAEAFALAIQHGVTGTFNVSGNRSVSMLELAETVLRLFGRDPRDGICLSGPDPQETFRGHYPVDAAFRAFGYRPQVALEEGLRRTADAWGLL